MKSRSAYCERVCLALGSKSFSGPVVWGGLKQVSRLRMGRDSFSLLQLISWQLEIRATAAAAVAQHVNLSDHCFSFMLIWWAVFCSDCVLPVLQPLLWHKEQITGWDRQVAAASALGYCWARWRLEVNGLRSFSKIFYYLLKVLIVCCNLALGALSSFVWMSVLPHCGSIRSFKARVQ